MLDLCPRVIASNSCCFFWFGLRLSEIPLSHCTLRHINVWEQCEHPVVVHSSAGTFDIPTTDGPPLCLSRTYRGRHLHIYPCRIACQCSIPTSPLLPTSHSLLLPFLFLFFAHSSCSRPRCPPFLVPSQYHFSLCECGLDGSFRSILPRRHRFLCRHLILTPLA